MPQSSKFEGVDFSQMNPERLTLEMDVSGQGFRSVRGEFVTYWRQGRVLREVNANISQCWILQFEGSLVGYITLLADKLTLEDPILLNEGVKYRTFPAVKIGLLAVDRRTKGVGRQLLEWAIEYVAAEISPMLGVRFMTVDALYDPDVEPPYDASGFYRRIGFRFAAPNEELPPTEPYRTLYLDLKPVIDLLDSQDIDST
ncbi:GNAT family N-acetyltransferase [Nostoc sp. TCL26-01]|uniref:GNAT family N-acetyltransferase n=1 Tax=Nostoc sp. TCL26-01 TaxID=2576904 RepID=UPI0015B899F6|nr:GNAT family N-acetyltransferase [Nostoc sp. TCL26-01]QLE56278.1 GNAT family N-acetyltransferase [Nostoc sp. TCL26-01]